MGGAFAVSVGGALAFLVAFVRTLGRWRRARVRQVVWALVPVVSLAWLAWCPFLLLALIRRRARDWAVLAAYLAAVAAAETVLIVISGQDVAAANRLAWLIVPPLAVTAAIHTLVASVPGPSCPPCGTSRRPGAPPSASSLSWMREDRRTGNKTPAWAS